MTHQKLNGAHICAGFKQMNRKGMPEGMRCYGFGNVAEPTCFLTCLLDGIFADVLIGNIAEKQPVLGSCASPPIPQGLQQFW